MMPSISFHHLPGLFSCSCHPGRLWNRFLMSQAVNMSDHDSSKRYLLACFLGSSLWYHLLRMYFSRSLQSSAIHLFQELLLIPPTIFFLTALIFIGLNYVSMYYRIPCTRPTKHHHEPTFWRIWATPAGHVRKKDGCFHYKHDWDV